MKIGQQDLRIQWRHCCHFESRGVKTFWSGQCVIFVSTRAQVIPQLLVELQGCHTESALDRVVHWHILVMTQVEVLSRFRHPLVVEDVVHDQTGLHIENSAMVAGFVIGLRILLDAEQVRDLHHRVLLQNLVGLRWNLADPGLLAIHFNACEVFGKTFFKPRIGMNGQIPVHQAMRVFVKNDRPRILHRHIEQDEGAILSSDE